MTKILEFQNNYNRTLCFLCFDIFLSYFQQFYMIFFLLYARYLVDTLHPIVVQMNFEYLLGKEKMSIQMWHNGRMDFQFSQNTKQHKYQIWNLFFFFSFISFCYSITDFFSFYVSRLFYIWLHRENAWFTKAISVSLFYDFSFWDCLMDSRRQWLQNPFAVCEIKSQKHNKKRKNTKRKTNGNKSNA